MDLAPTPIVESPTINARVGRRVLFKMECHQPPGSFKIRGMSHLMSRRAAEGMRHFVSSSGGNAGLAVAYCAAKLGLSATVVVPETTNPQVREKLASYGAEVRVSGSAWDEADQVARALCASGEAAYVSPFNDPLLWEGHASLADEAATQIERPDAVIISVGGGGLLSGLLQGMHRNGWEEVPVIAAETEGAASFAAAVAAGGPVSIERITSIATSLGARQVADQAFRWTQRHEIRSAILSDRDAIAGCLTFADHLRVLVEPACGVSLAVVEQAHPAVQGCDTLLVVVCGGAAVNASLLCQWRDQLAQAQR